MFENKNRPSRNVVYTCARSSRAKTRIICGHDYATLLREVAARGCCAAPRFVPRRVFSAPYTIHIGTVYTANSFVSRFATRFAPTDRPERRLIDEPFLEPFAQCLPSFFPFLFKNQFTTNSWQKTRRKSTPRATRTRVAGTVDTTSGARGFRKLGVERVKSI